MADFPERVLFGFLSPTKGLLEEGWVLTCQARCVSGNIRIEYPE
jgi:hypothetical protein